MSVHDIRPDLIRTAPGETVRRTEQDARSKVKGIGGAARADRVEISAQGRALSLIHGAGGADEGGLSPERVERIRRQIRDGFYDSPDIMDRVARALLDSGDL